MNRWTAFEQCVLAAIHVYTMQGKRIGVVSPPISTSTSTRQRTAPRSEHLTGNSNAGINLDYRITESWSGCCAPSQMGVCKQTVDRREYRLGLCHFVYFLELGVDG